jgi:hypothetical protein
VGSGRADRTERGRGPGGCVCCVRRPGRRGLGSDPGPGAAERIAAVRRLAAEVGCALLCVRLNKDGSPAHPSRGSYQTLQPWPASPGSFDEAQLVE